MDNTLIPSGGGKINYMMKVYDTKYMCILFIKFDFIYKKAWQNWFKQN